MAPPLARGQDQPHDGFAVDRVESTRRLVGEQDVAIADDGARDGHALAFATGELVRVGGRAIGELERARASDSGRRRWLATR